MPAKTKKLVKHKRWFCPVKDCGLTYNSPIPITGVDCAGPERKRHNYRAMKPVVDDA